MTRIKADSTKQSIHIRVIREIRGKNLPRADRPGKLGFAGQIVQADLQQRAQSDVERGFVEEELR